MSASATMRKTYSGLIGKSDIGKSKAANYELPPADFTYGKSSGYQAEGAKESLIDNYGIKLMSYSYYKLENPHSHKDCCAKAELQSTQQNEHRHGFGYFSGKLEGEKNIVICCRTSEDLLKLMKRD